MILKINLHNLSIFFEEIPHPNDSFKEAISEKKWTTFAIWRVIQKFSINNEFFITIGVFKALYFILKVQWFHVIWIRLKKNIFCHIFSEKYPITGRREPSQAWFDIMNWHCLDIACSYQLITICQIFVILMPEFRIKSFSHLTEMLPTYFIQRINLSGKVRILKKFFQDIRYVTH